ncbi:MAG: L-histidine N(alpha)-methyltransferase [Gemmatimonadaceae bacterium]
MTSSRDAVLERRARPSARWNALDARRAAMLADVRSGFAGAQKTLPPKYFYDNIGSRLFEEITALPEYYLTRTERRLLHRWMPQLVRDHAARSLLELGAGSGEKTAIILEALRATAGGVTYYPLDISAEFLAESAASLSARLPGLRVSPIVADLGHPIVPPRDAEQPMLFAFLGSTIGNFDADEATALLQRVRAAMHDGDVLLLGTDLHKDAAVIERAYNDAAGITAQFNRNVLCVLNRELGADFDVTGFRHAAPYVADRRRVEMHLVAQRDQLVHVPGVGRVQFRAGESIRTEICCKYDRATVELLLRRAGLTMHNWWQDDDARYALTVAVPLRHRRFASPNGHSLSRRLVAQLQRDVRDRLFALARPRTGPQRIGAEVEVLLLDAATREPAPIAAPDGSGSLAVIRALARRSAWPERRSGKAGVSEFDTPRGGRITFEPGGQLEYSAPPVTSLSALARDLCGTMSLVSDACADAGIACVSLGIDPFTPVEATQLQLDAERYRRMDRHFARIGPFGSRMMRQTAALQICLDAGTDPHERWRLLQGLAPYLVAICANSPVYQGVATQHASFRAHTWRSLDPARTGLAADETDATLAYTRFALQATTMLLGAEEDAPQTFAQHVAARGLRFEEWDAHLTTLFPEVRPRGYFEVRSADAIAPELYVAPLAFLAGLAYHPPSARAALALVGSPGPELLTRAGRCALADPAIARVARDLWRIAREGWLALGDSFIHPEDAERVDEFVLRFSARERSPAHEVVDALAP